MVVSVLISGEMLILNGMFLVEMFYFWVLVSLCCGFVLSLSHHTWFY